MTPLTEPRRHDDRNVVPSEDDQTNECPLTPSNLTHMRATDADE
jgi:ribosomal protein L14E/L6E/L27E